MATRKQKNEQVILSGLANKPFARKVAKELGLGLGRVRTYRFSDQEAHVIVYDDMKEKDVYIVQPTSMPVNENIMELLLTAHAVKDMKPKRITAVIPFFGYRRQEKKTNPGESLSFQLIAKLLKASGVDRVLVIDLHKHRSAKFFKEADITCKELRAFEVIVEYFKKKRKLENFVVLAPDKGSIPESERYAKALDVPLIKVYKRRHKRDEVTMTRFEGDVAGKNVLIIDDEINTAGTLVGVAELLREKKAKNLYFACTHAVLSGPAIERLKKARIRQIVVTDSVWIPPKKRINKIKILSVTPLFVEQIEKWKKR